MSRISLYVMVAVFLIAGLSLTLYRHIELQVPWTPGETRQVWHVEGLVSFEAHGDPVKVSLALPDNPGGFRLLSEHTASPGYGLHYVDTEVGRRAEWTIRQATGRQQIYYSVQFLVDDGSQTRAATPALPDTVVWEHPLGTSAQQVIDAARERSADAFSFTRELARRFTDEPAGDENIRLLMSRFDTPELLVRLLHQAGIAARLEHGLILEDGRRRQVLEPWVGVFDGDQRLLLNPRTGKTGQPDNLLLWEAGGSPVLEVQGGTESRITYSMLRRDEPAAVAAQTDLEAGGVMGFSIHSLPLEEQALFKNILLIPIGALVVVILRVLVGIKTSGTFMPVLIALAFMQTTLLTGLIAFLLIVSTGLMIRSYLSHLNLLLVARVSAVIITVILIISAYSLLAYRLGFNEGLVITFFPMIILSWTIERMSILWEEEGAREVFIQGGGSLLTAVLAFLAMDHPVVQHLTFNFLGLQLILMALILLLGNYSGYRLLELRRFSPLGHSRD
ncbi:MAG TPA: gonadoliberin III [Thioalkalivibrio sp.]|mgnify:CR=1 FL=1|nr:gonadoliberin III [Thioalkalivibrio sp.]